MKKPDKVRSNAEPKSVRGGRVSRPKRVVLHTPPGGIKAETPKRGPGCRVCGRKLAPTSETYCVPCRRAHVALEGSPARARRMAVVMAEMDSGT